MLENKEVEKRYFLIKEAEEEIIEKIKKLEARDDEVVKIVKEMKKSEVKVLRDNKWQIEEELISTEEREGLYSKE